MMIKIISNSRLRTATLTKAGQKPVVMAFPPDATDSEIRSAFGGPVKAETPEAGRVVAVPVPVIPEPEPVPPSGRRDIVARATSAGIPNAARTSSSVLLKKLEGVAK